ncbi:MAG: primosomal protein N' [Prevotellaceae bacterium]|nr:primosomal protein N' [Prevotellaceae bacterium]
MDNHSFKYIEVILPLPLKRTFTYAVPLPLTSEIHIGMRVVVPFGGTKMYTGIIRLIHTHRPDIVHIKEIVSLLDDRPILRRPQLKFWEWISTYYQAALGEVYHAAVPAGLKLESETQVRINPDFEPTENLSKKETLVLDALSDGNIVSVAELNKWIETKNILPTLKSLFEKNMVEISEKISQKYRPKTETCIRIAPQLLEEKKLKYLFDSMNRTKKQLHLLMTYIDLSDCLTTGKKQQDVSKKELLEKAGTSDTVLNTMLNKGIFEITRKEIGRLDYTVSKTTPPVTLNPLQKKVLNDIESQFIHHPVVLLHGVTSSGKTELYIHLITKALSDNKQVLYLVPEIALTTQLTSRLKRVFGNLLGVYHSKFSDAERVEIWNNVLRRQSYEIIIGVRSSIFLPFHQLGLIIVDEEHETTYKQHDPSPRYHARNAAIVLAAMHGAKTLLGTATPSVESYHNTQIGKYGLVTLRQRFAAIQLPEITTVDLKEAYRKKQMNGHFSDTLIEKITQTLANNEQILLFQNRRGYAPVIQCGTCGHVLRCKNCDVSLTLHKVFNTLNCHYCGYTETIPITCPECSANTLQAKGAGTEKIEDEIKTLFPDAHIARLDLDTGRNKKSHQTIIRDFELRKTDILVGTQMISKGFDFTNLSLVGVLNADNLLNFPDFRAHERAFQLLLQVSGRSGRKNKRGQVILQTSQPEHTIITQVQNADYIGMFESQCAERKQFYYPPFYRLIQLSVKHRNEHICKAAASQLADDLRKIFGNRLLGPNSPLIPRIQNRHIRQLLIKLELNLPAEKAKQFINQSIDSLLRQPKLKGIRIIIDVDPN